MSLPPSRDFLVPPDLAEAASSVVARRVVGRTQRADPNARVLILGVDELIPTDVDANVREARLIGVLEEDQVTRLQRATIHRNTCRVYRPRPYQMFWPVTLSARQYVKPEQSKEAGPCVAAT